MNNPHPPGWLLRLYPWLRPHRRYVTLAFGGAVVGSLITAATPLVERKILNDVLLAGDSALAPWVVVLVGFAVGSFASFSVRRYWGGRVSLDVQFELRNAVYDHLSQLDLGSHDKMQTGQLVSRANSDVGLLQNLIAFLPIVAGHVTLLTTSMIVMFILNPLLAVGSLIAVPAMLFTAYRMRTRIHPANRDVQQIEGEIAVVAEEAITGVRVVKGFGQEQHEVERLVGRTDSLYAANVRANRIRARYQPCLAATPQLAQIGVLALGGYLAIHREISLGTYLAFSTYLVLLGAPARVLANVLVVAQQARAGAERIFDLLETKPTVVQHSGTLEPTSLLGDIAFDDVTFDYVAGERVLNQFALHVNPGETVALVGTSGSGKTTAAVLLLRLYDATGGCIRIDGIDIRDFTLDSLRRSVSMVFEDSFLFSTSIAANIAYGKPDATKADIESAARMAEAHEFISALPDGYETTVGERGMMLSGGQRQRIALARALILQPRILVLDEATSAVDPLIEAKILDTLRRVLNGCTTLLISHRHSTLAVADRVAVVDGGRIIDQGTHRDLIGRLPRYRSMFLQESNDHNPAVANSNIDPFKGVHQRFTPSLWIAKEKTPPSKEQFQVQTDLPTKSSRRQSWFRFVGSSAKPTRPETSATAPVGSSTEMQLEQKWTDSAQFTLRYLVRPYRRVFLLGLLLVVLDALASLAGPTLIRSGIDEGVARGSLDALWDSSLIFLAITGGDIVIMIAETRVTGRTAARVLVALRTQVWSQLQRLSIDFYEQEMSGEIMTRMTTDIDAFSTLLDGGLINALVSLVTCVGVGAALLLWNWTLALLALIVVFPLTIATDVYRRRSGAAYSASRERIATVNANMQENLAGIREVQAYGRQARNEAHFHGLASEYLESRLKSQRLLAVYFSFIQLLSDCSTIVVVGVGSILIGQGSLSSGELIGFLLYLDIFFSPIQQLSETVDAYQEAAASRTQIAGLMRRRSLTPGPAMPTGLGRLEGRLTLKNVHFTYPNTQSQDETLRGVNLEFRPGETVAIVGATGAGKSTIMKLIIRFYDPTAGLIAVDGMDLRYLDLFAFRRQIGYVPQDGHLFSGTIRDNIAYGRWDATNAEVEAAARKVRAHDVIAGLSGGYLAEVSERGSSLSAGERQLIALARAELVDPAILLLDEATSKIDLTSESRVVEAMSAVARGRTTVLIAHRLQTARRAHRIIVIDAGLVAEDGTHSDLIARGGRYARMWETYSRETEAEL
jgi:ATP-binding cassette subfamily B protein